MEKVYQVMAWPLAAVFAIVVLLSTYDAQALTLKSGEVLTSEGVKDAGSTENAKRNLAKNGYHVSGGNVYLDVDGTVISVSLSDLRGKSKTQISEIIGEAAVEQLSDQYDSVEAHVAELSAEGMDAINGMAMSAEKIANHIMESDSVTGAVAGISEEVHEQVQEILSSEIVTDAAGIEYNPNDGPCSGAGC